MIRPVLKKGNPLLHEVSREVESVADVEGVITDLWDTLIAIQGLYNFTRGSGIAAPQIGELWRVNAVEFEGQKYTLINGRIKDHSPDRAPIREGCLSFFDLRGMPLRYEWVTVEATDPDGKPFEIHADADFSSLLQHELDHLDGVLYDKRMVENSTLTPYPEMPHIP